MKTFLFFTVYRCKLLYKQDQEKFSGFLQQTIKLYKWNYEIRNKKKGYFLLQIAGKTV